MLYLRFLLGVCCAALVSCANDGTGGGCDNTSEAVIMFDPPLTAEGAYELSVEVDPSTSGTCTVELAATGREDSSCSPSTWFLLAPSTSTEVDDGGLSSGAEPDILGIRLGGETEAGEGHILVTKDGTTIVDDDFSFEEETLEESCGTYTRPRADISIED